MKPKCDCPCDGTTLDRLLQPAAMAMLLRGPLHGYTLVERLRDTPLMQGQAPDPSGVYRMLATLEKKGLVTHEWEKSSDGPSKREYQLTDVGITCTKKWIDTLDEYYDDIGRLVAFMRDQVTSAE